MVDFSEAAAKAAEGLDLEESTEEETSEPAKEEESSETEEEVEETETEEEEPEEEEETGKRKRSFQDRFNQIYREKKELERMVVQLVGAIRENQSKSTVEEKEEPLPDFDTLTNSELVREVLKLQDKRDRKLLEQIDNRIKPVQGEVANAKIMADIQETAAKYADFKDYVPQMIEIAERHPDLSAEEVYLLASRDTTAAKKAIAKRMKDKMAKKKAARTETRSSAAETTKENKKFKSVREAGLDVAKKLGMI